MLHQQKSALPVARNCAVGTANQCRGRRLCLTRATPCEDGAFHIQMKDRMEEEKKSIRTLKHREVKARLLALGIECDGLHDDALVERLAAHLVLARSQVIQFEFKLRRSGKKSNQRKSYLVIPVDVEGIGFVDFLIDSGTSSTLITGNLRTELGVSPVAGNFMTGLDSSGLTIRQKIRLPPLRIGSRELELKDAIVTRLDLDDSIGGVLGLSFLRQIEMDVNRDSGTVAFHPVGHADQVVLDTAGMSKLRLYSMKGGLIVMSVSLNGSPPIPAILDLSANFSNINGPAAQLAGLSSGTSIHTTPPCTFVSKGLSDSVFIDPQSLSITLGVPDLAMVKQVEPSSDPDPGWEQLTCISNQPVLLRDMPSLAPLGFKENSPVMILGTDVICKKRAVLALGTSTLYLYPS